MCQPVGTWADTATARTWFALNSRRHSAVTSGDLVQCHAFTSFVSAAPPVSAVTIWFNNYGSGLSTLIQRTSGRNGAAMAQKVQTLYVDDLDGSEADGTIRFGLDGTEYEIDLNAKHTRELRDVLARYVAAGRRVRASTSQSSRSGRKAQPNALNTTEVREWAKAQGIEVKDRGRIPAELVVKFKAAAGPVGCTARPAR